MALAQVVATVTLTVFSPSAEPLAILVRQMRGQPAARQLRPQSQPLRMRGGTGGKTIQRDAATSLARRARRKTTSGRVRAFVRCVSNVVSLNLWLAKPITMSLV